MDVIENTLLAVLNDLPSPWLGDVSVGAPLAVGTGSVVLALTLQHVVLAGRANVSVAIAHAPTSNAYLLDCIIILQQKISS